MRIAGAGGVEGADGGFDEGPFEKGVDLFFGRVSVADAVAGGDEPGDQSRVAGQAFGAREARHISDLESDDGAKGFANAGKSHQPLDGGSGSDFGADAFFEGLDFDLELIEGVELHDDHAGGDRRQFGEAGIEIFAAAQTEEVAETL